MNKIEKVIIILCDTLRAESLPHYGSKKKEKNPSDVNKEVLQIIKSETLN